MNTPATPAPMTIEILYFDGCRNHEKLLTHLPLLLEHEGITADIVLLNIPDTASAVKDASSAHQQSASTATTSTPVPANATTTG
jgi:hypothetical protein